MKWVIPDRQGSTAAVTDSTGKIIQRFGYDSYGNETASAPGTGYPFRYTGQRSDPETGLSYYKARFYSAKLGRFLQTDPIGYKDDLNLYTYVGNDPLNFVDPSGKCKDVLDSNGKKIGEVGLCGDNDAGTDLVEQQLGNKNSKAKELDEKAIAAGVRVGVKVCSCRSKATQLKTVAGAKPGRDAGHARDVAITVRSGGEDLWVADADKNEKMTGTARVETLPEDVVLEHEMTHALQRITGEYMNTTKVAFSGMVESASEAGAVNAENDYMRKEGYTYRRIGWSIDATQEAPEPRN